MGGGERLSSLTVQRECVRNGGWTEAMLGHRGPSQRSEDGDDSEIKPTKLSELR